MSNPSSESMIMTVSVLVIMYLVSFSIISHLNRNPGSKGSPARKPKTNIEILLCMWMLQ